MMATFHHVLLYSFKAVTTRFLLYSIIYTFYVSLSCIIHLFVLLVLHIGVFVLFRLHSPLCVFVNMSSYITYHLFSILRQSNSALRVFNSLMR